MNTYSIARKGPAWKKRDDRDNSWDLSFPRQAPPSLPLSPEPHLGTILPMDTFVEAAKWVLLVLAAGFIGQFGKSLALVLLERRKARKAREKKREEMEEKGKEPPSAPAPPPEPKDGRMGEGDKEAKKAAKKRAKLEKKQRKAELKRMKKGAPPPDDDVSG